MTDSGTRSITLLMNSAGENQMKLMNLASESKMRLMNLAGENKMRLMNSEGENKMRLMNVNENEMTLITLLMNFAGEDDESQYHFKIFKGKNVTLVFISMSTCSHCQYPNSYP